jgi:predicted dehydrogenase
VSEPTRVAVIGAGHFGSRHVEKYAALADADLVAVVDADRERAKALASSHSAEALSDHRALFGRVDAVSIAVPTSLHHAIGRDCLNAGIHVLIEKPVTETVDEAEDLIAIAGERGLVIQVGHLQRFSPAYFAMADRVTKPLYIEANRISPFNPRVTDVSVVLDLMIHDIDLITALVGAPVASVDAIGAPVVSKHEDIVNTRVTFENGCVANLTASRVSLKTERTMRIFQPESYIQADLAAQKVVIRQRGEGEMFPGIPNIAQEEFDFGETDSLMLEIQAFLDSVRNGTPAKVDGAAGRDAVHTAQRITDSLRAHRRLLEQSGVI